MSNSLKLVTVLWLCKRTSLYIGNTKEVFVDVQNKNSVFSLIRKKENDKINVEKYYLVNLIMGIWQFFVPVFHFFCVFGFA
jgi:hypothetical protein